MRKGLILFLALFVCLGFAACEKQVVFTINFVVDGAVYKTVTTTQSKATSVPPNPTKDGYKFDGWFWDEGTWEMPFTANSLSDAPLSSEMRVYAKWTRIGDISGHIHEEVIDAAVPPTCTETGLSEGKHCFLCSEVLVEQTVLDALTHSAVADKAVAPTCTETGLTEGSHCSRCNTVLVAQEEIPATDHTESEWIIDKKTGKHTECTVCGEILRKAENIAYSQGLAYQVNSDKVSCTVTGLGTCTDTNLVIPEQIDGYKVTVIGDNAFAWSKILSATVPDTVTVIGRSAFCACLSLEKVELGGSVTVIESDAFMDCVALESIKIPDSLVSIGRYAFQCCEALKRLRIPASLEEIGLGALGYCISIERFDVDKGNRQYKEIDGSLYTKDGKTLVQYALGNGKKKVVISDTVTCIGYTSFCASESIVEIVIPDSVTLIDRSAFHRCTALTTVTIGSLDKKKGNTYCEIADGAFGDCDALVTVILGNSVKSMQGSFNGCNALTTVKIGDSLETIGYAFNGCTALTDIEISNANKHYKVVDNSIYSKDGKTLIRYAPGKKDKTFVVPETVTVIGDSAFSGSTFLESVFLPDSVTVIENSAFANCSALKSMILPEGIKSIGEYTFSGCKSLVSITIPDSVKIIGARAFNFCQSLKTILIPAAVSTIGRETFNGCGSNLTIYCRSSAKGVGWDKYWNNSGCKVVWGYKGS